jgi:electron transport complex protein RnfD
MSSSPHINTKDTVRGIMLDVILALIPALLAGTFFFGFYSLLVVVLSVGCCILWESTYNALVKKPNTVKDLSCIVTGMLLGLNLPPLVPLYIPVIGSAFAIIIVKMLFGGIGKNFANPAIAARIFLVISFGRIMTYFISPLDYSHGFLNGFFKYFGQADSTASATPLAGGQATLLQMFLGNTGGCIGETSALALILGGIYLCVKKVIDIRLPLVIILTVAAFTFIFKGDIGAILPALLGGGLMIGSIFMATDYSTSPNSVRGMLIYAFAIGLLTAVIRQYSTMTEGMSYAILLANLTVPLIDKYIYPAHFGYRRSKADGK